ncbi:MAG TPA: putative 2-aminoethylphosphonate ABC transporter permease subunit [Candidatus Blautia stercoravium]|nr:putative 2-aminoethylphosphonate ABC transporter permease subunit [Candidatus Blautia stercoravium]
MKKISVQKLHGNPADILMLCMTLAFVVVLLCPLAALFSKAFLTASGEFAGLENYIRYFSTPALSVSIQNTMVVSCGSAVLGTLLGFLYAYGLTRTGIKGKTFFRYVAMIPLFLPTVVHGLSLVYLFGKQGIITGLGWDIGLYGKTGILLSEVIYTFPQSFLMFSIALNYADGRLYEAADSMGCSSLKKFTHITLPSVRYTLINSLFVCFTLAFTDFGAPKVLGGNYNVLATDIYKQVAGQFNMNMGAVVGTLLLIPAVISFGVDRVTSGKDKEGISSKAQTLKIKKGRVRDGFFYLICIAITLCLLSLVGVLFVGAFTKYYPYDMSFTLENFRFNPSTGGIQSYLNSIEMSFLTAVLGTLFTFLYAYFIERGKCRGIFKNTGKILSSLPLALPGMVIGLGFIFFFNQKNNPLHVIYGTVMILVLANMVHFYSVPFVTASSALKKLDKEYENVADSLKIPGWKTFCKVVVPLSLSAVLEIFMYYFMNSMVTVSAVVFLYSARFKVASIAITHMEEAGDIAQAAAMSLLILLINVVARGIYEICRRQRSRERRTCPQKEKAGIHFLKGRVQSTM